MSDFSLGIDDTDSNHQMCTTYLGTLICELLLQRGVKFVDFPKLVRLNPNIPFKTRGNGAIAIHFRMQEDDVESLWSELISIVKQYSAIEDEKTHPGMVLLQGIIPLDFHDLYLKALYNIIPLKDMKKRIKDQKNLKYFFLKEGRGLIGACCAIGAKLNEDYTYELIAYRTEQNRGTSKRKISKDSVIKADEKVPLSFNNVDYESNDIMITPHGSDPILCGIRGETPEAVIELWRLLEIEEPVENIMIFRTNQHTKVHFPKEFSGNEIKPYLSVKTRGLVIDTPRYVEGGHVIFGLKVDDVNVDCAAYEPTKKFRNVIINLAEGDELTVFGGIRKPDRGDKLTINLEEIQINHLVDLYDKFPPKCPQCGLTLKSAGKSAGFKCKKCNYRTATKEYIINRKPRKLRKGVRYVTPVCAQRHLTKPVQRDVALQFHLNRIRNFANAFDGFISMKSDLLAEKNNL
jgi:tRNA(Ile2)-agmatinylcytidine synthase